MDQERNFSLSYEQLTRIAEEHIRECELDSQGAKYISESAKAGAILSFWYGLALQGYPGTTMDERVDADRQRLHALIHKREG